MSYEHLWNKSEPNTMIYLECLGKQNLSLAIAHAEKLARSAKWVSWNTETRRLAFNSEIHSVRLNKL